jgi:polar amino acid transport system substrate-binding protein
MPSGTAYLPGRLGRHLTLGLLCLALSAPLLAAEKLTLCYENKMVLPWRTVEQAGLNFELLKRVESRLGLAFDYQLLPWKRCLAKLKANEVDGAFSVSHNPDRASFGAFPGKDQPDAKKRLHYARYFLIRKKDSPIDWDGKQFHNANGAILFHLGYSVGDMLRAQNMPVDESSDTLYNVGRKVLMGRVAGAALMDSDAAVLMRGPMGPKLEMIATPLVEKPYYLILSHKLVAARPELAERIWKTIEEVRNSKEYGKQVQAAGAENAR